MKELIDGVVAFLKQGTELLTVLTVMAQAEHVKAHGETQPAPEKSLSEDVPAPKRGGKKKVEPAANPNDDILAEASGKGHTPAAPKKVEMTDEESAKAVTDTAKLLVSKYSKPVSPDNKPEGFHIAKALLIEDFKVGRLSDLSHEQRIDFVREVKAILLDDKKAQAILNRKAAAV